MKIKCLLKRTEGGINSRVYVTQNKIVSLIPN